MAKKKKTKDSDDSMKECTEYLNNNHDVKQDNYMNIKNLPVVKTPDTKIIHFPELSKEIPEAEYDEYLLFKSVVAAKDAAAIRGALDALFAQAKSLGIKESKVQHLVDCAMLKAFSEDLDKELNHEDELDDTLFDDVLADPYHDDISLYDTEDGFEDYIYGDDDNDLKW